MTSVGRDWWVKVCGQYIGGYMYISLDVYNQVSVNQQCRREGGGLMWGSQHGALCHVMHTLTNNTNGARGIIGNLQ